MFAGSANVPTLGAGLFDSPAAPHFLAERRLLPWSDRVYQPECDWPKFAIRAKAALMPFATHAADIFLAISPC
jgi:hypothetical protein